MSRYIDADLLLAQCRRNPLFEKTEEDKRMVYIERSIIDATPTADVVEVRHGEWLPTNIPTMFSGVIHECSICKAKDGEHSSILGYYCWRCGAKMDVERSENGKS